MVGVVVQRESKVNVKVELSTIKAYPGEAGAGSCLYTQ
jgi:hypothetical protein